MLKPIETEHNGYKFRSRLEARWAVFFDSLGIKYEYEEEGYDLDGTWYLPDFWLPTWDSWVEIKPEYPSQEEKAKGLKLRQGTGKRCLIIWGSPYAYIPYDDPLNANVDYRMKLADRHFLHKHTAQWKEWKEAIDIFTECPFCMKLNYSCFINGRCHGGIRLECRCDHFYGEYGCEITEFISPRLIEAYKSARQARFEHQDRLKRRFNNGLASIQHLQRTRGVRLPCDRCGEMIGPIGDDDMTICDSCWEYIMSKD
jgi:hypothetical protein